MAKKGRINKSTGLLTLLVLVIGLAVGIVGLQSPKLFGSKAGINCKYVGDNKYQVNAISKVISIDNSKTEFKWGPDEKSNPLTILGWCSNTSYVRRGYGGEEDGDTPMEFGDLKADHRVEIIGFGYEAAPSTHVVPSLVRDVSLYKRTVTGRVSKILTSQAGSGPTVPIGFVMTDVIGKNNGKPNGNDISVHYSSKVGCRRAAEVDYDEDICRLILVGHKVEVSGVYDETKQAFVDPASEGMWTKVTDSSLKPENNSVDWSTGEVSLKAHNFWMVVDGKKYYARPDIGNVTVKTDPADPEQANLTTLLVGWRARNDDIKIKFTFKKDSDKWWLNRLQTYTQGRWSDYQVSNESGPALFYWVSAPKDQEFAKTSLEFPAFENQPAKGKIHFDSPTIKAFIHWTVSLPDLQITNAKVENWDKAKKSVKATYIVKNSGGQSTRVLYDFTNRSGGEALEDPKSTCKVDQSTVLAPGESCQIIHIFTFRTIGEKTLTLTLDYQGVIPEVNENNNVRSVKFNIEK